MNCSEKGDKHKPVMIHRAVLGSIERFTAILTESFAGEGDDWGWQWSLSLRYGTVIEELPTFIMIAFSKWKEVICAWNNWLHWQANGHSGCLPDRRKWSRSMQLWMNTRRRCNRDCLRKDSRWGIEMEGWWWSLFVLRDNNEKQQGYCAFSDHAKAIEVDVLVGERWGVRCVLVHRLIYLTLSLFLRLSSKRTAPILSISR